MLSSISWASLCSFVLSLLALVIGGLLGLGRLCGAPLLAILPGDIAFRYGLRHRLFLYD